MMIGFEDGEMNLLFCAVTAPIAYIKVIYQMTGRSIFVNQRYF